MRGELPFWNRRRATPTTSAIVLASPPKHPGRCEACTSNSKSHIQRGSMKARTSLLIIFVAAVFVFATVSRGYPAQTTSGQERTDMPNQSGDNPNITGSETAQQGTTN